MRLGGARACHSFKEEGAALLRLPADCPPPRSRRVSAQLTLCLRPGGAYSHVGTPRFCDNATPVTRGDITGKSAVPERSTWVRGVAFQW
ncbi:hypothetical protein SKAU_G00408740 [Synaphobranchus kaupii]|uniref:Uncharacterized protein n=1 Tax=Synaphobranchus kaupii TaxID=118154 RepID=A0A9Q1ICA3_SYNKA|nr:hypothetical protein SKAU_G00408740 [Synaphobranchus kaupii]